MYCIQLKEIFKKTYGTRVIQKVLGLTQKEVNIFCWGNTQPLLIKLENLIQISVLISLLAKGPYKRVR